MFNKKLKYKLEKSVEDNNVAQKEIRALKSELNLKNEEIKRLEEFNKKIDAKIEELCKPKINAFCLSMVESELVVSAGTFGLLDESHKRLEELFESQAKELSYLKERDEDNKKILFLSAKVEQLLNKLNKK